VPRLSHSKPVTISLICNYILLITAHVLTWPTFHSVKDLESQVTSLESEVDHLSRSLGAQRTVATEAESSARKAAEEHARDAASKVCHACWRDPGSDVI